MEVSKVVDLYTMNFSLKILIMRKDQEKLHDHLYNDVKMKVTWATKYRVIFMHITLNYR